ncbi:MAG: MurR/RpiR family transcriptional regulator [Anaerolineae bacterium]
MLLQRLRHTYSTLSKSHRRLADYLTAHFRQVAFMTSTQFAAQVNVNSATVTRFAQSLGYRGYPELMEDLRVLVRDELAPETLDSEKPAESALSGAIHVLRDDLERLNRQVDQAAARQAQELLTKASKLIILTQGSANQLASLVVELLALRGQQAAAPAGDPYALAAAAADAEPGSLYVGLAILDESWEVAAALRYAGQLGADTLAIASSPTNPILQAARLSLSWLAEEANPAATIIQASNLLAALITSAPYAPGETARTEKRLSGAIDAVLARRRRTN